MISDSIMVDTQIGLFQDIARSGFADEYHVAGLMETSNLRNKSRKYENCKYCQLTMKELLYQYFTCCRTRNLFRVYPARAYSSK